jgi:hypothetical protein
MTAYEEVSAAPRDRYWGTGDTHQSLLLALPLAKDTGNHTQALEDT